MRWGFRTDSLILLFSQELVLSGLVYHLETMIIFPVAEVTADISITKQLEILSIYGWNWENKNRDPYVGGSDWLQVGMTVGIAVLYVRRANRDGIRLLQNMRGSWVIVWNMKWYLWVVCGWEDSRYEHLKQDANWTVFKRKQWESRIQRKQCKITRRPQFKEISIKLVIFHLEKWKVY